MSSYEFIELKNLILEQKAFMSVLFPNKISISFVVERTGMTRQEINKRLTSNYKIDTDFWKEKGKIFMTKTVALQILNIKGY